MGIPLIQQLRIGGYLIRQRLLGRKRDPLAMMLEPLFQCNLACAGCGTTSAGASPRATARTPCLI